MTINQVYLATLCFLILIVVIVITRMLYVWNKEKADLSRALTKIQENEIDQEIDSMALKSVIDRANQRNGESAIKPKNDGGSSGDPGTSS